EEKNTTPKEFSSLQLQSKGFHEEIAVDDFPLRGLVHWFKEVEGSGFKSFSILKNTITHHYNDILNYFNTRSTNASAESFNAKIKNFRMQLRGVKDKSFFLFRLSKIFA
ncbi:MULTISPECIES: transposase, partial [unclassified Chryseobacterium]|uniref:transposase n=1 Tax=unclassified Chryseobacterium TaxID=2593645 RepID=UPI00160B74FE